MKLQELKSNLVTYIGDVPVKGHLPAERVEKSHTWTQQEIEKHYPGKYNPLKPKVGATTKTYHYVHKQVDINPGDHGYIDVGPSRQVLTRSGRAFQSDSYFVREHDHARINVDQFPRGHRDIKY